MCTKKRCQIIDATTGELTTYDLKSWFASLYFGNFLKASNAFSRNFQIEVGIWEQCWHDMFILLKICV